GALAAPPSTSTVALTLPTPTRVSPGRRISSGVGPFTTSSGPTTCTEPVNKVDGMPLVGTSTIGVVTSPAFAVALAVNVTPGPSTPPPTPAAGASKIKETAINRAKDAGPGDGATKCDVVAAEIDEVEAGRRAEERHRLRDRDTAVDDQGAVIEDQRAVRSTE